MRITLFVPSLIFSYAITILWILTVINAFNFMDNMNGLCAGLGAIGACYLRHDRRGRRPIPGRADRFLTFGALLGFLPYNFPRARAFLGDAGSHLVGYLLAVLAILPHFYTARAPSAVGGVDSAAGPGRSAGGFGLGVLSCAGASASRFTWATPTISPTGWSARGLTRTQAVLLIWLPAHRRGRPGAALTPDGYPRLAARGNRFREQIPALPRAAARRPAGFP